MEGMVSPDFYRGKRVLVTGHTGFKGSWLAIWLHEMGALVYGIALDPQTPRDNYVVTGIGDKICQDLRIDIRDAGRLRQAVMDIKPEIIFHLAAQPLVRLSYAEPVETWETNVMGTLHVMEAMRACPETRVGVMITTDKCYENREQLEGYRETDPLGGYDPYSASKGACEIAISSWRRSFLNPQDWEKHHKSLASVRAGNVVGGGDWAKDRIVPDCIRAIQQQKVINIRSPKAIRPWQHVLEPLSGYLLLAQRMWEAPTEYCEAWNFGPRKESVATVWDVASRIVSDYGQGQLRDASDPHALHEAQLLLLNIDKAQSRLRWQPRLSLDECLKWTVDWYKTYTTTDSYSLCVRQIRQYINKAR